MVRVPAPPLPPTTRSPLVVQEEPAPSTATKPFELLKVPIEPEALLTAPFTIISVPVLEAPTLSAELRVQAGPVLSMITRPDDCGAPSPILACSLLNWPPFWIVSVAWELRPMPTLSVRVCALAASITVLEEGSRPMFTSSLLVGTLLPDQFPAVNQSSVPAAPVHSSSACDGVGVASASPNAAREAVLRRALLIVRAGPLPRDNGTLANVSAPIMSVRRIEAPPDPLAIRRISLPRTRRSNQGTT